MRLWILAVVAVALAACGGIDDGGAGGAGGKDGPPCYAYTVDPGTGTQATHCTDADHFCWWTGRHVTGDEERACSSDTAEAGCFGPELGHEIYGCVAVRCWEYHIDNAPCCDAGTCD